MDGQILYNEAMLFIETGSTRPEINLAFEEYFLHAGQPVEPIWMLYQNDPVVVVGRFQNTLVEINAPFLQTHSIPVMRRITGGGTVYHDRANLCFAYIQRGVSAHQMDVPGYLAPLIRALTALGVPVELSARHDLLVAGKKFSGTALAFQKNHLLFHGTLLFDSDLSVLRQTIGSAAGNIEARGVKSVKSPVANLKPWLPGLHSAAEFKQALKAELFGSAHPAEYQPAAQDWDAIRALAENKYQTWEWTYGNNPSASVVFSGLINGELMDARLQLDQGRIQSCQFWRGAVRAAEWDALEKQLAGVRYTAHDLEAVFARAGFSPDTRQELLRLLPGQ